ncbi:MAG TPA: PTS sugar transporter subunit IIA [Spirochaetia bacterium]|nr:PTS sugar transporter subunit IIA [Spirochaetia bacterium]
MLLIDLIESDIIRLPLVSTTKSGIIRELVEVLKASGRISEVQPVYDALMVREDKGSTGLERGIAVPHARTEAVKNLTVALGISPGGVNFDALDGKPSHLFFLILAAPGQSGPHIEALAEIARLTRSQGFCDMLINATSPEEVVRLIKEE